MMENSNIKQTIKSPQSQKQGDQPESQPLHPHTQKFYMLLIILGIIFLATLLTAVLYIIGSRTTPVQIKQTSNLTKIPSPTPNPTVNWKTYTNKDLGFSIRYPENIREYYFPGVGILGSRTGSNIIISLLNIEHPYLTGKNNEIRIMWYSNETTPNKIIDDVIQAQKIRTPSSAFEKSYFTIDGEKEEAVTEKRPPDYELQYSYIKTNKAILEFMLMYQTKNKEKTLKLFNQILSTFKFLDQNLIPDPSSSSSTITNPASVYCIDQGGQSKIMSNPDGSQYGLCIFSDGRQCDEWDFFRTKICK